MSKQSQAFLTELDSIIRERAAAMTDFILGRGDSKNPLLELSAPDTLELRSMSLTTRQAAILGQAMRELGRQIIFSALCIIDGVSYVDPAIPALSLVERDTRRDINDEFLHDEFVGVLAE